MMKRLFLVLLLPISLCASKHLTVKNTFRDGHETCVVVSDGLKWTFLSHLGGTTLNEWKPGDHVFYWHMPNYSEFEYRIFNMDHFGCYKVYYRGRVN